MINNACRAQDIVAEQGSLAAFLWRFEPSPEALDEPQTVSSSPASVALSRALKQRGWKFVGPTTIYAFMQAMGLINDHAVACVVRAKVEEARSALRRPVI